MDTQAFEYRMLVFRLKNGGTWKDCLQGKKLMSYRNIVISEHPVEDSETTCEWNYLHYHALVEHSPKYRFDSDRVFNQFRNECCDWMKSQKCKFPVNALCYFSLEPRHIIYRNTRDDTSDIPMLEAQITPELIEKVKNNKAERVKSGQSKSNDIMILKDMILESQSQSESELMENYCGDEIFEHIFCKRTYKDQFKKALQFAIMSCLDTPYIELVRNYKDKKDLCLSITASYRLMKEWFKCQKIEPTHFITSLMSVMDHKARKRNCLVLKGAPNSGKTFIAKSIEKACIFFGEVTQGTSGYAFMWQDCTNKRVIVINEPFFDLSMIESLKAVLEGTGTFVHKKNTSDDYLRPTPVIVTTNHHLWSHCPSAEEPIRARCYHIYDNLIAADCLKYVTKDLHPGWILPFLPDVCREAPAVSDISDDECTSPGTVTVDQVPILGFPTQPEDLSIYSTSAADNTTSILRSPVSPKKPSIDHLLNAPVKPEYLETYSRRLLQENHSSPKLATPSTLRREQNPCQTPTTSRITTKPAKELKRRLSLSDPTLESPPNSKQIKLKKVQEPEKECKQTSNKQPTSPPGVPEEVDKCQQ